jgi:membrane-associated phospholipid phosphatase
MRFQKAVAETVSTIFNPLLMPTIGILIILQYNTYLMYFPYQVKNLILIITAGSTFILPLSFYPIFYFKGIISGINIENHRDRIIPLSVTVLLYFAGYILMKRFVPSDLLLGFWLGFSLSVLANLIVSFVWKISSHMIGVGGILGLLFIFYVKYDVNLFPVLLLTIMVSGLLAYSRLRLNFHNLLQIFAGITCGFIVVFFTMFFY